jgi:hypothetical protein
MDGLSYASQKRTGYCLINFYNQRCPDTNLMVIFAQIWNTGTDTTKSNLKLINLLYEKKFGRVAYAKLIPDF